MDQGGSNWGNFGPDSMADDDSDSVVGCDSEAVDSSWGEAFGDDSDAMANGGFDGSTDADLDIRARMLECGNFILASDSDPEADGSGSAERYDSDAMVSCGLDSAATDSESVASCDLYELDDCGRPTTQI